MKVDDKGNITAVSPGYAYIYAELIDGNKTDSCRVSVKKKILATELEIFDKKLVLTTGDEHYTSYAHLPYDVSTSELSWTSSNPSVVSVNEYGRLTAKKAGEATITVKTIDGSNLESTCKVTVKNKEEPKPTPTPVTDKCALGNKHLEWREESGKKYWCENGKTQAVTGDPKNIIDEVYNTERGREIYDPSTNGWYWLDSNANGAKAEGKEVWVPYIYQDELNYTEADRYNNAYSLSQASNGYSEDGVIADMSKQVEEAIKNKSGKWVRYDSQGKMAKGWYKVEGAEAIAYPNQAGNVYYYDQKTGLMAKGWTTIDGINYFFDEITGVLQ